MADVLLVARACPFVGLVDVEFIINCFDGCLVEVDGASDDRTVFTLARYFLGAGSD